MTTNPEATHLEQIAREIHAFFEVETNTRERALKLSRSLIQACSRAIRAVHRDDISGMAAWLEKADEIATAMRETLQGHPALYFSGYAQDAIKEYVEAHITCALIRNQPLPAPKSLQVEPSTYLRGLAEVVGELRRRALHLLRDGDTQEADRLLAWMEDIYAILVTMDYPDAITYGLRRQTDIARSLIERTESDLTFNRQSQRLTSAIQEMQSLLAPKDKNCE